MTTSSEVVSMDDQQNTTTTTTTQQTTTDNNNSPDFALHIRKENSIDKLLNEVKSEQWGFQKQMDTKCRQHLRFLLLDRWTRKKPKKEVSEKALAKQLDKAVKKCFDEMMYEYSKWCSVAGRKNRIGKSTLDRTTAMLLLLTVFGEIDLLRTQNHVCQLLFHLALKVHLKSTKNANLAKPYTRPNTTKEMTTMADIIVSEARYGYELVKVFYNKNLMNEEFFDWDDLNDLCWTPGFVRKFLKRATKESVFSIGGFQRAFNLKGYPFITAAVAGQPIKNEEREKLKSEKAKFVRRWKTYMDRAGGPLGIKGYITLFLNFYHPVYYQLLCMVVAFGWLFNFNFYSKPDGVLVLNYVHIGLTGFPLVIFALYFIFGLLFRFWTKPSILHPHRFTIPRRDKLNMKNQRVFAWLDILNWIPNYILSLFHRHHFYTLAIVIVLTALYIVVMRWVLFESVRDITTKVITVANDMIAKNIEPTNTEIANIAFIFLSFVLLWLSLLFVCAILPPILFSVCAGILGFVKGWWVGANRIKTWKQMTQFFKKDATLAHFKKKMLCDSSSIKSKERDSVEAKFAIVWNAIIDEFYENHQCSKAERARLSYKLQKVENQYTVVGTPDFSVKPICSDVCYHLVRFVNNLYQNMPVEKARVLDMKRLSIVTPVYREKVYYSWEELVETTNTSQSFLKCLITKYTHDWKNFKDKEFPEGTRLRKTVEFIESKVLSGVDITHTSHKKFAVTQQLKMLIKSWASQRFQPVSRTIKGFMRVPKALSILLKLQNPEMTDEQVRRIVRQKFTYMIGAQLYDETVWKAATGYDRLPNDQAKRENEIEYQEYIEGLNSLSKTVGDNMLKIAYVKQVKVRKENSDEYEKKYRGVLTIHEDGIPQNVYEVDAFGDFSQVGQGKPTNQGFTAQFFDATYIQAIDCNMDSNLTQSLFVPNVLKEFDVDKRVMIVGCPEYIFTSTWSQFGYAAAFTERVFGSMIQRVWSMIGLRMHYGHPDFLRGLFVMFTTGMSKLSYISEDVFLGFDTILNKGRSIQVDYFEVGKARDVDTVTTTKFNRKIAMGAAQLACSRYPYTLLTSTHLTYFDKLLFCFSVISHYSNTLFTILAVFTLYSTRLLIMILLVLILRYFKVSRSDNMYQQLDYISGNISLVADSMYLFQMGMALAIPGIFHMVSERGLIKGLRTYIEKLVILLIFSMFQLMNIGISFHSGFKESAKYLASGRGTGLQHRTGREVYSIFKDTHFYPGGLMLALVVIGIVTGGSTYYIVFHGALILIWVLSPLLALPQLPAFAQSIAPWRSGYLNENRHYDEMIEIGGIMEGMRSFWLGKKNIKVESTAPMMSIPLAQQPLQYYQPLDMHTVEKMNAMLDKILENNEIVEVITVMGNIFSLDDIETMKNTYQDCQSRLEQYARSGVNIPELASLCSDYLFLNKESSMKIFRLNSSKKSGQEKLKSTMILGLAQFDLFPHYNSVYETVKKATLKIDHILATEMHYQKASECTHQLIEAGCTIVMDNRGQFEKLMFSNEKGLRELKNKVKQLLSQLSNKAISIAKQGLLQAHYDYDALIAEQMRRRAFCWPELPDSRRVELLSSMQDALNYAKRLTESRTSQEHVQVNFFTTAVPGSQVLATDAFEGDNGAPIFDQMLPILGDDVIYIQLSDTRRKEIKTELKRLIRSLTEEMKDTLMDEGFLEIEATCQDMFELLEKGDQVLKKHISRKPRNKSVVELKRSDSKKISRIVNQIGEQSTGSNSRVT